ncbi:MAG: hypothetical protein SX243_21670 [Acidobacteriota bacterium]|nr:hypothetical protein [Acidobacteriota bacterium]
MKQEPRTLEGEWVIEASQCRCLPIRGGLKIFRNEHDQAVLQVTWRDIEQEAVFERTGGEIKSDRASFEFSTPDGAQHLLVAAIHHGPDGRSRAFGFVTSRGRKGETGTGAWTANDVDPTGDPSQADGDSPES